MRVETRQYSCGGVTRHRPNGRSSIFIECPFCQTVCEAYVWSLAGSGKRCPRCGALHGYCGQTIKTVLAAKQSPELPLCHGCGKPITGEALAGSGSEVYCSGECMDKMCDHRAEAAKAEQEQGDD